MFRSSINLHGRTVMLNLSNHHVLRTLKSTVMENKKKKYVAPKVECIPVQLEQGLAISSATISGGVDGSEYTPDVEEWGTEENGGYSRGDL